MYHTGTLLNLQMPRSRLYRRISFHLRDYLCAFLYFVFRLSQPRNCTIVKKQSNFEKWQFFWDLAMNMEHDTWSFLSSNQTDLSYQSLKNVRFQSRKGGQRVKTRLDQIRKMSDCKDHSERKPMRWAYALRLFMRNCGFGVADWITRCNCGKNPYLLKPTANRGSNTVEKWRCAGCTCCGHVLRGPQRRQTRRTSNRPEPWEIFRCPNYWEKNMAKL